jgi:preprotein translocase subunit Sec63
VFVVLRSIGILVGWIVFAFVAYQVYITPSPEVLKWNPFDILGVPDVSTAVSVLLSHAINAFFQRCQGVGEMGTKA